MHFVIAAVEGMDLKRLRANASIHQNVTYESAGELTAALQTEVRELLEQAERADQDNRADGQKLPAVLADAGYVCEAQVQALEPVLESSNRSWDSGNFCISHQPGRAPETCGLMGANDSDGAGREAGNKRTAGTTALRTLRTRR